MEASRGETPYRDPEDALDARWAPSFMPLADRPQSDGTMPVVVHSGRRCAHGYVPATVSPGQRFVLVLDSLARPDDGLRWARMRRD